MSEERQKKEGSWAQIVVYVLLILSVALASYVGGYFAFGREHPFLADNNRQRTVAARIREFKHPWMVPMYFPLTKAESLLRGIPVVAREMELDEQ